jgi:hypothetical protein
VAAGTGDRRCPRRRRRRATYKRPHGVRHLLAAYDLSADKLYGHIKARKGRTEFLQFCRYLRRLYPPHVRIAIVLDNFSPHLSTKTDDRVGRWAERNNVEFAYVPFYGPWLMFTVGDGPIISGAGAAGPDDVSVTAVLGTKRFDDHEGFERQRLAVHNLLSFDGKQTWHGKLPRYVGDDSSGWRAIIDAAEAGAGVRVTP